MSSLPPPVLICIRPTKVNRAMSRSILRAIIICPCRFVGFMILIPGRNFVLAYIPAITLFKREEKPHRHCTEASLGTHSAVFIA
jgi:hypothetical protein